MKFMLAITVVIAQYIGLVLAQSSGSSYTCSTSQACTEGCCSTGGYCGFGPTYCGAGNCTSDCDRKSQCDPGWGIQWSNASTCPLKVCCSQYGFCGTTSDFCGDSTVVEPSCNGNSVSGRTIGYYEGWNMERTCDTMSPSEIPLGYYTHINFAFVYIDPTTFEVAPMASDVAALYSNITQLKMINPGLQVWMSVGGWSFNDPDQPTKTTFSDLAASSSDQTIFFSSLITFMINNGFDGIDIDWEYPAASDRSGQPEDFENYPTFLANLRSAMQGSGLQFGLSVTLPSSYWYLQNFDIISIDPIVDWFNLMTYDLHGTWDGNDPYIGAVALAHTNLTEIGQSLDLLWRNNIDPGKVNMGLGFYGRSFTMSDPSCLQAGCPFSGGGNPGPCTATSGILSDPEIQAVIDAGATVTLDQEAAVMIVTWDTNQWVSYDNAETFKMKIDYANSRCLGGTMVWAVDMDDLNGTAIHSLGSGLNTNTSQIVPLTWPIIMDNGTFT